MVTIATAPTAIDENATFTRGAAPVLAVTVHRHMVVGPGALTNPVDYAVMVHLLFAVAGGEGITAAGLLARLREQGVTSPGDVRRLIGRDAVYSALARLVVLGFVRKVRERGEAGRLGPVSYEVYEQPLHNPDVARVPQFAPLPDQPDVADVSAGQAHFRVSPTRSTTSGSAGHGESGVSAGGDHFRVSPTTWAESPTPPMGGGNPPTPRGPESVLGDVVEAETREGGSQPSGPKANPEQLAIAEQLLSLLDGPLSLNTRQRRVLAPLVVEQAELEGWPLDHTLIAELAKDLPSVVKAPPGFVRKRLEALAPHRAKAAAVARKIVDPCMVHPGRERAECKPCRSGREDVQPQQPLDEAPVEQLLDEVPSAAASEARAAIEAAKAEAKARREREAAARAGRARGFRKKLAKDAEEATRAEEAHRNDMLNQLEALARSNGEFIAPAAPAEEPEPQDAPPAELDVRAAFAAFTGAFQLPALN